MALHEPLAEHAASPARRDASSVVGEQINAQYLAPPLDDWRAHCGLAVTPVGTSLAQKTPRVHLGEQKAPAIPVMVMLTSSLSQACSYGSP